ncbi:MAG: hypothetical protein PVJ57_11200 [Phycisphaerae bacterium]
MSKMVIEIRPQPARRATALGFGLAVCVLCSCTAGCAALKIQVDVYKGELIRTKEARLAEAVAISRNTYHWVKDYQVPRDEDVSERGAGRSGMPADELGHLAAYRRQAVDVYEGVGGSPGIEKLWAAYLADPGNRANTEALAKQLVLFGSAAQGLGRGQGLGPAVELASRPGKVSALFNWRNMRDDLEEGITLEEAGNWIVSLADSVLDKSERSSIAAIMESVSFGHVATVTAANTGGDSGTLSSIDERYWHNINHVKVFGAGETEFVLAKDDIGNWHIKSVQTSQDEIVNAIFDGAESVITVLAAQYGITGGGQPLEKNRDPANLISKDYINRQTNADSAERITRRVRNAQLGLAAMLISTSRASSPAQAQALLRAAAAAFNSQLQGLESGDEPAKGSS